MENDKIDIAEGLRKADHDWFKAVSRNNRMISICICMPIDYFGNVPLSEELRQKCMKLDYAQILRELIVDNVCIKDIAAFLKLPDDSIENIVRKYTIWKVL